MHQPVNMFRLYLCMQLFSIPKTSHIFGYTAPFERLKHVHAALCMQINIALNNMNTSQI